MNHQFPLTMLFFLSLSACNSSGDTPFNYNTQFSNLTAASSAGVSVKGSSITLTYDQNSNNNGFLLKFEDVGSAECSDIIITTTQAYGLVPVNDIFKPYDETCTSECGSMWQYSCTKSDDDNTITLTAGQPKPTTNDNFRPWVDKFDIHFRFEIFNTLITETVFNVQVNNIINANQVQVLDRQTFLLNQNFKGCGLYGTVLQRVFDCSKKIKNYAVYVNILSNVLNGSDDIRPDGTSDYYTLFSPALNAKYPHYADSYWFVVACPNTSGASNVFQLKCTWLTPIVSETNPAIEKPGLYQTFSYDMLSGYQKRLLFSGVLDNGGVGFTFDQANSFTVASAQDYELLGFGTEDSPPSVLSSSPSVCSAQAGNILYGAGWFTQSDANTRDLVSNTTGASVSWNVPSYPMLNILTGGTPTDLDFAGNTCSNINNPWSSTVLFCNVINPGNIYFYSTGFNAINVPGFIPSMNEVFPTDAYLILWSSSASTMSYNFNPPFERSGLAFTSLTDSGAGYTSINNANDPNPASVRCSSLTWY